MTQSSEISSGRQIVIATFGDQAHASAAVEALRAQGFPPETISVVVRHDAIEVGAAEMAELDRESEAVGTDVAIGGTAGGVVGFLAGLALFSIPGLGPFLGVGVLATTLGGAVLGSAAGQRTAEFSALGLPEDRAERYSGALESGQVILALTTDDVQTAKVAHGVLTASRAQDIDVHPYRSNDERPTTNDQRS